MQLSARPIQATLLAARCLSGPRYAVGVIRLKYKANSGVSLGRLDYEGNA
jgi:hypothetical protein